MFNIHFKMHVKKKCKKIEKSTKLKYIEENFDLA